MTAIVKIKLRAGVREIEIEAVRSDVDSLLERWWQEHHSLTDTEATDGDTSAPTLLKQKKKRPRSALKDAVSDADGAFDPNAMANQIKEHQSFDLIAKKIVHARGDRYNKIALVLWIAEKPLTSGQIHRVLEALDVRISLPNVSDTLKANMSKFLTSVQRRAGGPPANYRLSAQAKADFEKWLAQNEQ
jgi:hypothetical protein